jgi:hypothetical protein
MFYSVKRIQSPFMADNNRNSQEIESIEIFPFKNGKFFEFFFIEFFFFCSDSIDLIGLVEIVRSFLGNFRWNFKE